MSHYMQLFRPDPSVPWGFRLQGGRDFGLPLIISAVTPHGVGERGGLHTGDRILAIGGDSCVGLTHQQAQQAVIRCGNELTFDVVHTGGVVESSPAAISFTQYSSGGGTAAHYEPGSRPTTTMRSQMTMNLRGGVATSCPQNGTTWPTPQIRPVVMGTTTAARPTYTAVGRGPAQPSTNYMSPSLKHAIPPGSFAAGHVRDVPQASPGHFGPPSIKSATGPFTRPSSSTPVAPPPQPVAAYQPPKPVAAGGWKPPGSSPVPVKAAPFAPSANNYGGGGVVGSDGKFHSTPVRKGTTQDIFHRPASGTDTPVCYTCKTQIRGPYLAALDHCFCPNHFTCAFCQKCLSQGNFLERQGQFYCEADFSAHLAPRCARCGQPVVETVVTALEKKWHSNCFVCHHCKRPISDSMFRVADNDGEIYCEAHWVELYQVKCARCDKPVDEIDRILEAFGKTFHAACFTCAACMCPLEGKPFHSRDGKAFCKAHAHAVAVFG